jgi:subtilisin
MRRSAVVATLIVLLAIAGTPVAFGRSEAARPEAGPMLDWIVTVDRGVDAKKAAPGLAKQAGGTSGRTFEHAIRGFVFHGTAKQANILESRPGIRTVVPDRPVRIAAETRPPGIARIRANHASAADAYDAGFRGSGARVAVLDTGIDLTHPDLVANLDVGLGLNCMTGGAPQDGHGHGTHVAGTIAGRAGNNIGVIGVAPEARVVPVKVLNDSGEGEWSNVICGIDHVTGLALDGDPSNDVDVVNMSLGDVGGIGTCTDGGLREAICRSTAAGVVYVAASGNSFTDASTFIPAAFPEVVTVSAMTDFDGEPGGLAGCRFIFQLLGTYCDDQLAAFANKGSVIDVTAPGVEVFSSWTGGGYQNSSGTSMAAPHVAGVATLVRSANQALTPSQIEALLELTGDFPDGSSAEADCGTASQWGGDVDGVAEPLVNALRAAQRAANPGSGLPVVQITAPANGAPVSGTVGITATASDPNGIASVQFLVDGSPLSTDNSAPFTASWDSGNTFDGPHQITARATDTVGSFACAHATVTVGTNVKGDWVGTYGVDGYVLGAWTGSADLAVLPAGTTLTVLQAGRATWANPSSDVRALKSPDGASRRAMTWWDNTSLRLRLNFTNAYSGTLHVYALDWDGVRRQNVTVADGTTTKTVQITTSFNSGAWMHFPITVGAGGQVTITADRTGGANAVLGGLFLGGAGAPPQPAAIPPKPKSRSAEPATPSPAIAEPTVTPEPSDSSESPSVAPSSSPAEPDPTPSQPAGDSPPPESASPSAES